MDKLRSTRTAGLELEDAPAPPKGFGQRELMAFDDLFRPDMPDGKLINLYFLVEDWHMTDKHVFADAFKRVGDTLMQRMSGGLPDPNAGNECPVENDDEIEKAEKAIESNSLAPAELLRLYSLASSARLYEDRGIQSGVRWQLVMDRCREYILQRIRDNRPPCEPEASEAEFNEAAATATERPVQIRDYDIPTGYRVGDYEKVKKLLSTDAPTERMLDLLLYACDEGDGFDRSHPDEDDWRTMFHNIGRALEKRLDPMVALASEGDWYDYRTDWSRQLRKAEHCIPDLPNGRLLMLYISASKAAFYREKARNRGRWELVAARCRNEIVHRAKLAGPQIDRAVDNTHRDHGGHDVAERQSVRGVLRRLEATFRPSIDDETLLRVYLEVCDYNDPDIGEVFDEIHDEVRRTILVRMGAEDPEACCVGIPYDYPDHGAQTLQMLTSGELPPEKLLFICRLSDAAEDYYPEWQAVHDLSRAQILRRMKHKNDV